MLLFSSIVLENPVSALKKKISHSGLNANDAVMTVLENNWSVLNF